MSGKISPILFLTFVRFVLYFTTMMSAYQNSSPSTRSQTIKCLTPAEVDALLSYLASHRPTYCPSITGPRNLLLVLLMLDAGLRVGELVQLTRMDLWIDASPVHALLLRSEITKSKKERYIPLTGKIQSAITALYNIPGSLYFNAHDQWVFPGRNRNTHLTTRQVGRIINNISHNALTRTISPHTLRHTFATRLMRTTSVPVVQNLLGHANLASTQIYTHPSQSDLTEAIRNL